MSVDFVICCLFNLLVLTLDIIRDPALLLLVLNSGSTIRIFSNLEA